MENKQIEQFLQQERDGYEPFQGMVNDSLQEFCDRNNEELGFFLFKTLLGREVCQTIASHVFESALKDRKGYAIRIPKLIHNSASEARRVSDMLSSQPFQDYLRNHLDMGLNLIQWQEGLVVFPTA